MKKLSICFILLITLVSCNNELAIDEISVDEFEYTYVFEGEFYNSKEEIDSLFESIEYFYEVADSGDPYLFYLFDSKAGFESFMKDQIPEFYLFDVDSLAGSPVKFNYSTFEEYSNKNGRSLATQSIYELNFWCNTTCGAGCSSVPWIDWDDLPSYGSVSYPSDYSFIPQAAGASVPPQWKLVVTARKAHGNCTRIFVNPGGCLNFYSGMGGSGGGPLTGLIYFQKTYCGAKCGFNQ
ncbi:hypothetical protein [uncultured Imperialibacter sp.]|uniref:hypothetical protein n=1 Tax=uncultured Imperialibacter sp. TaxID=1672639 RepID=UPI0030DBDF8F|tara:strand:- start:1409 stop:2119 length:711 start_codon:yes stop_codon:yes gene_type:complete